MTVKPRLICPCCGAKQPLHSAIAYCDDCNNDTCGHHEGQEANFRDGQEQEASRQELLNYLWDSAENVADWFDNLGKEPQ